MSQAKKGNKWYFGMKLHISVGAKTGLVHTVKTTTAKRQDAPLTKDLMRPDDQIIFDEKGRNGRKNTENTAQNHSHPPQTPAIWRVSRK